MHLRIHLQFPQSFLRKTEFLLHLWIRLQFPVVFGKVKFLLQLVDQNKCPFFGFGISKGYGGPSRKIREIPGGGGSNIKPSRTENPEGWGVKLAKTLCGRWVWIFSGTTQSEKTYWTFFRCFQKYKLQATINLFGRKACLKCQCSR